jgi:hypothetical protein
MFGLALQVANNLRLTRDFKLRIERLEILYPGSKEVAAILTGVEVTPAELGILIKEGLASAFGGKKN